MPRFIPVSLFILMVTESLNASVTVVEVGAGDLKDEKVAAVMRVDVTPGEAGTYIVTLSGPIEAHVNVRAGIRLKPFQEKYEIVAVVGGEWAAANGRKDWTSAAKFDPRLNPEATIRLVRDRGPVAIEYRLTLKRFIRA